MRSKFDPAIRSIPNVTINDDPYVKFIIDRRQHEGIFHDLVGASNRKCSLSHSDWETTTKFGKKYLRIKPASSQTSLDISKDIEVPTSGLYRIEFLILRGPDYTGNITPLDGSTTFEDPVSAQSQWQSENWFKTRLRRFTAGTHTFGVRITKGIYIGAIKVVPVVRHEGDSDGSYYGENEVDILSAEWSRNSVNEVNPATLMMPFQDDFYQNDHNYSPFIFSLKDSITILVGGERRSESAPIFGGYITGWTKNGDLFSLNCLDSLLNLNADLMYENYAIGAPPEEGKKYIQFSNVYDTFRYMAETTLHRISPYNVPASYGFRIDFGSVDEYNQIIVSGFGKERNATEGNPDYCLRLYRASTGASSAVLYQNQNNPYDAAKFPILNIDYKASSSSNAMNFDIFITMHRQGQSLGSAVQYAVNFSGAGGHSNTIATVTPNFNGKWNYISLNLPDLFKAAGVPSTEYYISKVELKGTISSVSPAGSMYFDNICSYKKISDTTKHSNEEVRSIFEIIQDLGDKTKHAVYIRPGLERCDDILVVQPFQNTTLPVAISDSSNLIECEEYGSMPLEDGFLNQAHTSFDIDEDTVGSSFAEKLDSVIHFEEYQRHESDNDLKSQAEVDRVTLDRVNENCSPSEYLTCKIVGSPFVEPNQNIYYNIGEHRCYGFGMLKSIDFQYEPEESPKLTATVGINRPSSLYNKLLFKTYRDIYNLKLIYPGGGDIYRSRVS